MSWPDLLWGGLVTVGFVYTFGRIARAAHRRRHPPSELLKGPQQPISLHVNGGRLP